MKIEANSYALVDYELLSDAGESLDDSAAEDGKPIRYVHGYGMLVPGLEGRLAGLGAGDKKELLVPAAEAYGEHDDELVYELERSEIDGDVEEGDEIVLEADDGEQRVVYVVELLDDVIVVDGNHPLAGVDLRYRVHVREVREATHDEIARAASDLESVEPHVHGADCAHDHEAPLMSLGRKKPDLS
jgi:FKBP-type peptidyl-prolyl cis-trans isomerase SlyD